MRTFDVEADTLQEWYDALMLTKKQFAKKKGKPPSLPGYHQQIRDIIKKSESYTEFGVYQGHTLAVALLTNTKKIRAYDIDLSLFSDKQHLFDNHAKENKIDFKIYKRNTARGCIEETDVLNIDSLHTYTHCMKELNHHGHRVKKYIIFHDTNTESLFNAVSNFMARNDWELVTRNTLGVGYTLIKRK